MENIWQSKSEIHLWLPIAVINFYQRKVSIVESFKPVQNQLYLFTPYKPTCIQILQTNLNRFPAPFEPKKIFFRNTGQIPLLLFSFSCGVGTYSNQPQKTMNTQSISEIFFYCG